MRKSLKTKTLRKKEDLKEGEAERVMKGEEEVRRVRYKLVS